MTEALRRKIVVLGDPQVGKSALLGRYLGGKFADDYLPTVDGEVMFHQATVFNQPVNVQFWDTTGGATDVEILKIDCKQAHACILAYDVTNTKSFDSLALYLDLFLKVTDVQNAVIFVVGCKGDLPSTSYKHAEEWSQAHNAQHWVVSSKVESPTAVQTAQNTKVVSVTQMVTSLLEAVVPRPTAEEVKEEKLYCDDLSCALEWPCEVHGEESILLSRHYEPVVSGEVLGLEYMDHVEIPLSGRIFKIRQDRRIAETGGMVWDASIILAEYLSNHPEIVRGKSCFELGAGLGLCGIVAGALGGRVVISDVADYIPIIQENITANLAGNPGVVTAEYRWGTLEPSLESKVPADVIFGSDIIYNPEYLDDLLASFAQLGSANTVIYLAHKTRFKPIEDHFFTKCSKDYVVQRIHAASCQTYQPREQVRIVRLQPRAG